jgi:hypothetical protein
MPIQEPYLLTQWWTAVARLAKNGSHSVPYCIAPEFGLPAEPIIVLNGKQ